MNKKYRQKCPNYFVYKYLKKLGMIDVIFDQLYATNNNLI